MAAEASAPGGVGEPAQRSLPAADAVRVADLHKSVQVVPPQGVDDRFVLGVDALSRLGLTPPPCGAVTLRHLPEPAYFPAVLVERGQVEDGEVEFTVIPQHLGDVVLIDRDHHLL